VAPELVNPTVCSATIQPAITAAYTQLAPALKPLLSAIAEVQQRRTLFCFGIAMHPFGAPQGTELSVRLQPMAFVFSII
jgi:hypothetical protein